MGALPDRIWVPAVAALLVALAFTGALLVRAGGDASLLVHAGAPCTTEAPTAPSPACDAAVSELPDGAARRTAGAPGSLTVQGADDAFDGQFFYRLGVAPWSTDGRVAGVQNDLPALRNARWGYGALAWMASAGDPDLVPWSLLGLNVAAATAVGAVGGGLARASRRHAAWGLLFALWPGFAYSLSLDTSELVAMAFALGGLLAVSRRRWVPSAVLLAAAVLTRDTAAVIPFGIALAAVAARAPARLRSAVGGDDDHGDGLAAPADASSWAIVGAVPMVAFTGWQLVQRARFGSLPLTSSGDNNLSAPFAGLAEQIGALLPPGSGAEGLRLVSILGLAGLLGAAAWLIARRRPLRIEVEDIAWLGAVAVVVLLNAYLWSGATAFMRAATEAGLLSILVIIRRAPTRLLGVAGLGIGGLWLLTAVAQLTKLG